MSETVALVARVRFGARDTNNLPSFALGSNVPIWIEVRNVITQEMTDDDKIDVVIYQADGEVLNPALTLTRQSEGLYYVAFQPEQPGVWTVTPATGADNVAVQPRRFSMASATPAPAVVGPNAVVSVNGVAGPNPVLGLDDIDGGISDVEDIVAGGAGLMTITAPGTGAVARPVYIKAREGGLYPEDFSSAAIGNGVVDAAVPVQRAWNEAAALGVPLRLGPGATYNLEIGLSVPATGAHIIGHPSAKLLARGANFTTTVKTHSTAGTAVYGIGITRPVIENLRIELVDIPSGGWVQSLTLREVDYPIIRNPEIWGGNAGNALQIDSAPNGGEIIGGYIHDWTMVRTSGAFGQVTGFVIDDDDVDGVASEGISVHGLRIARLVCSDATIAAIGDQSDGVTVLPLSKRHLFSGLQIEGVAEGYDIHGNDCQIIGGFIENATGLAVKLMHGASRCVVIGTRILRPRLAGVFIGGSNSASQNTDANRILNVAVSGVTSSENGYGLLIDDSNYSLRQVTNTYVDGISFSDMSSAYADVRHTCSGTGNRFGFIGYSLDAPRRYFGSISALPVARETPVDSAGAKRIGGLTNASRYTEFDASGRAVTVYNDNGIPVLRTRKNTGITAAGQGVREQTDLGASGVAIESIRQDVLALGDYANGAAQTARQVNYAISVGSLKRTHEARGDVGFVTVVQSGATAPTARDLVWEEVSPTKIQARWRASDGTERYMPFYPATDGSFRLGGLSVSRYMGWDSAGAWTQKYDNNSIVVAGRSENGGASAASHGMRYQWFLGATLNEAYRYDVAAADDYTTTGKSSARMTQSVGYQGSLRRTLELDGLNGVVIPMRSAVTIANNNDLAFQIGSGAVKLKYLDTGTAREISFTPSGGIVLPGPYADDAAAAAAGLLPTHPYRRDDGLVAWRVA